MFYRNLDAVCTALSSLQCDITAWQLSVCFPPTYSFLSS